jgi:RNA polymerase sigma-70 factor (ECF subfamily)
MNGQTLASAIPADTVSSDSTGRLAALFDAHEARLYRLARRLTASADDANDLVQDTFLRAARSLRAVPAGATKEEAWLVRVLVNIRRDEWRRTAVRRRSQPHLQAESPSHEPSPESAVVARRAIWQALDVLPPRRRAVVVLCELEGLSTREVASLLGVSAITVRWHLSNGRRDLTRALAAERSRLGSPQRFDAQLR